MSKYGRASGGILVFIRKSLSEYFSYIDDFECGVIFKLQNVFEVPVLYVVCYLPPSNSPFFNQVHFNNDVNGMSILDDKLRQLKMLYPNYNLILTGDFNARTKTLKDFIHDDSSNYLPLPNFYPEDKFQVERCSKDTHGEVNEYGKLLIDMCCTYDIHFLNGRSPGDKLGALTCFTSKGCSLVDYTILSTALHSKVTKFEIGYEDQFTHLPQSFSVKTGITGQNRIIHNAFIQPQVDTSNRRIRPSYTWTEQSLDKLINNELIPDFYCCVNDGKIEEAVSIIVSLLQNSSKEKYNNKQSYILPFKQQPWWDKDLTAAKFLKHKHLRHLKVDNSLIAKAKYRASRNKYKALVKLKKSKYKQKLRQRLENCNSASEFWTFVKHCKSPHKNSSLITSEQWALYFSELFNTENEIDKQFSTCVKDYLLHHDDNCEVCKIDFCSEEQSVNSDITLEEIELVIDNLKLNTAAGIDGVGNDVLVNSKIIIVPMLCVLFNKLLVKGVFPQEWCTAVIVPIHKSGDKDDPDNYRGISLLTCISKIFTKVLSNRLVNWASVNSMINDTQAGFVKNKSTIDHIFVLQTLVTKYLSKTKGRFYSVYVDFSKAFDTVPHLHLFYSLLKRNLHGRVVNVLRNMYSKLKSCILNDGELSENFVCNIGTRQGCMLSPFLFIFYINELVQHVGENNCQGIYLNEHNPNVNLLLYADDLVIVGDHIGRVQKILNALSGFCIKWGLRVNMSKTKCMVYRNGGIVKKYEHLYYNGIKLDNVPYYKYLGVTMSTRLSWSPAQSTLAAQAKKALLVISEVNNKCDYSFKTACEIFDKCILPILTYGSEVWGPYANELIECVHNKFCKLQLGVGASTPTPAVLGECGRDRIYVSCVIKCIKYWLKLISVPTDSLLGASYSFLYNQTKLGKVNWASDVKHILLKYGFGWAWENQFVQHESLFIKMFSDRVKDCELQQWKSDVNSMSKLKTYSLFKENREREGYLNLYLPRRLRVSLARFRTGNHNLEIEKGRHKNLLLEDRLCKFCGFFNSSVAIEDEYHVLFNCIAYHDIRSIFIASETHTSNLYNFVSLMKNNNPQVVISLAHFINKMFKTRKMLCDL